MSRCCTYLERSLLYGLLVEEWRSKNSTYCIFNVVYNFIFFTAIPPPIAPALQAEVAMSSCNVLLRFREMSDFFIEFLRHITSWTIKKGYNYVYSAASRDIWRHSIIVFSLKSLIFFFSSVLCLNSNVMQRYFIKRYFTLIFSQSAPIFYSWPVSHCMHAAWQD